MKAMNTIVKILTALAAVAGVVYIVATYGEQIVAWCKKTLASMPCPKCEEAEPETVEEVAPEAAAEEAPAEEAAEEVAEEIVEEPAPEVVVAENEPVAEEADFAE